MNVTTYQIIKKIHLYACLSTAAVLLMFVLSSYVAIHHNAFNHQSLSTSEELEIDATNFDENDWLDFIRMNHIKGRLTKKDVRDGKVTRQYQAAGSNTKITYSPSSGMMSIERNQKSRAGAFFGIHRQRGYGGGLRYDIHAFLLDLTGIALILFSITGVIMWMRLLKNNRIAWIIFCLGLGYYACIMYGLMR